MSEADRKRVLVVDDSWVILDSVKGALTTAGYEVRTATGPTAALRYVPTSDLGIIDFHMPGLDGADLVRQLRNAATGGDCLFYLYTSDPEVATRFHQHGFDGGFLRKGDEKALVPQVDAVFRTIQMRKLAQEMRNRRRG